MAAQVKKVGLWLATYVRAPHATYVEVKVQHGMLSVIIPAKTVEKPSGWICCFKVGPCFSFQISFSWDYPIKASLQGFHSTHLSFSKPFLWKQWCSQSSPTFHSCNLDTVFQTSSAGDRISCSPAYRWGRNLCCSPQTQSWQFLSCSDPDSPRNPCKRKKSKCLFAQGRENNF